MHFCVRQMKCVKPTPVVLLSVMASASDRLGTKRPKTTPDSESEGRFVRAGFVR